MLPLAQISLPEYGIAGAVIVALLGLVYKVFAAYRQVANHSISELKQVVNNNLEVSQDIRIVLTDLKTLLQERLPRL